MMSARSERLRIAIFSDSALPVLNGVSTSVASLINELRHQGHSVHLYTARVKGHEEKDPNTFRFPSVSFKLTKDYPVAYPPFYPMLMRFRKHEYDLIHSHTPFVVGFVGLRWAESHSIPIVSTYHTLYDRYHHYLPLNRRYVRYKIAKHTNYYYNRVAHVITPSETSRKWLRRHAVDTPCDVIPSGAPAPTLLDRSEMRFALDARPEERILLYVGRLAREKNLETLFEMAALVFNRDPRARLWLVGDGPHRQACMARVRELGIGDRVRFFGAVPREEVDKFYMAADVFVFASVSETQGLVVQEAMTYGLPSVLANGGGASAALEPGVNGLLAKNEPPEFANAVLELLGDDELAARLSVGALHSVKAYSTEAMASQVLGVYRKVLNNNVQPAEDRGILIGKA